MRDIDFHLDFVSGRELLGCFWKPIGLQVVILYWLLVAKVHSKDCRGMAGSMTHLVLNFQLSSISTSLAVSVSFAI